MGLLSVITPHTLAPNLPELRETKRPLFEKTAAVERLALPPISRYRQEYVRGAAVDFACYALAIERDDALAGGYFKLAAACASRALGAPGAEPVLRSNHIDVLVDPQTQETEVLSVTPLPGYGTARMSVVDFVNALYTLFAFGDEHALRVAASIPEVEYRTPGIVMSEGGWLATEAEKLLALGQEAEARAIYDRISDDTMLPWYRERLVGLRALWAGDQKGFEKSLGRLLRSHKAKSARMPGAVANLVCFAGMMSCRLAQRNGIRVEDQTYLPLRFSPWYQRS